MKASLFALIIAERGPYTSKTPQELLHRSSVGYRYVKGRGACKKRVSMDNAITLWVETIRLIWASLQPTTTFLTVYHMSGIHLRLWGHRIGVT